MKTRLLLTALLALAAPYNAGAVTLTVNCGNEDGSLQMAYNSAIWPKPRWFLEGKELPNAKAVFDSNKTITGQKKEFSSSQLLYTVKVEITAKDRPLYWDVGKKTVPVYNIQSKVSCTETTHL